MKETFKNYAEIPIHTQEVESVHPLAKWAISRIGIICTTGYIAAVFNPGLVNMLRVEVGADPATTIPIHALNKNGTCDQVQKRVEQIKHETGVHLVCKEVGQIPHYDRRY